MRGAMKFPLVTLCRVERRRRSEASRSRAGKEVDNRARASKEPRSRGA